LQHFHRFPGCIEGRGQVKEKRRKGRRRRRSGKTRKKRRERKKREGVLLSPQRSEYRYIHASFPTKPFQ